jgi:hypothetical protein
MTAHRNPGATQPPDGDVFGMVGRLFSVVALLIVVAPGVARAESGMQLTPFVGFRFGGGVQDSTDGTDFDIEPAANFGLVFDKRLKNPETTFQFVWSHQGTDVDVSNQQSFDLDIDYFHVGATYSPGNGFVVITVGATQFDPGGNFSSETKFSAAAGGGVRKMVTDKLGYLIEGRAYLTFAGGSSSLFCSGGGGGANCLFTFDGDVVLQASIDVGLIIAF